MIKFIELSTDSIDSFQPDLSVLHTLIGTDPEDIRMYMSACYKDIQTVRNSIEIAMQTVDAGKLGKAKHQLNTMIKMYGQYQIIKWETEAKTALAEENHELFRKKTQCILDLLRQWSRWLEEKLK